VEKSYRRGEHSGAGQGRTRREGLLEVEIDQLIKHSDNIFRLSGFTYEVIRTSTQHGFTCVNAYLSS
jgi:hypothetical protein